MIENNWCVLTVTKLVLGFTLDAFVFGILLHKILQTSVNTLEISGQLGKAKPRAIEKPRRGAVGAVPHSALDVFVPTFAPAGAKADAKLTFRLGYSVGADRSE